MKNKKKIIETVENADIEAQKEYNQIERELKLQRMIVEQAIKNEELLAEKKEAISHYKTKIDIIYNYLLDELEDDKKEDK